MTPSNIIDYFATLTKAKARTQSVRQALAAAGRAHQLYRKTWTGGPGREATKPHDPNAVRCWCVECRSKFPSYRNRVPRPTPVHVRTVKPLPPGLPLNAHNIAAYFDSLTEKDLNNPDAAGALHAAARVFPLLRHRDGPIPKITPDIVQKIKRLYSEGKTQVEIAALLNIAQTSVSNVVRAGTRDKRPIRAGKPSITSVILEAVKTKAQSREVLLKKALANGAKSTTVESIISQMLNDGRLVRTEKGDLRKRRHGDR